MNDEIKKDGGPEVNQNRCEEHPTDQKEKGTANDLLTQYIKDHTLEPQQTFDKDIMQTFKLVFRKTYYDQESDEEKPTGKTIRIIVADNIKMAKRIGEAMLNEEYEAYEYLTSLLKVESTKEDPDFPSYGNGTEEWNHVFQNLNLRPFDVILIGYDDHIVGFLTHELKEVTK